MNNVGDDRESSVEAWSGFVADCQVERETFDVRGVATNFREQGGCVSIWLYTFCYRAVVDYAQRHVYGGVATGNLKVD